VLIARGRISVASSNQPTNGHYAIYMLVTNRQTDKQTTLHVEQINNRPATSVEVLMPCNAVWPKMTPLTRTCIQLHSKAFFEGL